MTEFVATRASMVKKNAENNFTVVTFNGKRSSLQTKSEMSTNTFDKNRPESNAELKEKQEKEMKKFRFEVMKFGMTGLTKDKARKANLELAIKLGAKPPKNRRQNYKKLLERRKQEDEDKKKESKFSSGLEGSLLTMKKSKKKNNKPQRRDKGILGNFGVVKKSQKKL